jgi:hypothetical protein
MFVFPYRVCFSPHLYSMFVPLYIFPIFPIFRSLPSWEVLNLLCVSRSSSWSLRGRWRLLRGVLVVFDIMDVPRIHQGSYISIFRSLPTWKVLHLLCVSRASSWSLRGRWRFLRGVLVVFDIMDVPRIHQGSCILIFKSLPALEVLQLLGSPERHPSVFHGV